MRKRPYIAICFARCVRAGVFAADTVCPTGSKMTDRTYTFNGDLATDWTLSNIDKVSREGGKVDVSCCIKTAQGMLKIAPKFEQEPVNDVMSMLTARTKNAWALPIYVAAEGVHDALNQQASTRSEIGFIDGDNVKWVSSQQGMVTDGLENRWISADKPGSKADNAQALKLRGRGAFTPTDSWINDRGVDRSTWTTYMMWSKEGLTTGFLNPANPKTNLSLSFKASDFGTEWPIGNEKGNSLTLTGRFGSIPTENMQSEAWSLDRVQVSGCLFDGDGKVEQALAQPPPPAPLSASAPPSPSLLSSTSPPSSSFASSSTSQNNLGPPVTPSASTSTSRSAQTKVVTSTRDAVQPGSSHRYPGPSIAMLVAAYLSLYACSVAVL